MGMIFTACSYCETKFASGRVRGEWQNKPFCIGLGNLHIQCPQP